MRRQIVPTLMIAAIVVVVVYANWRDARRVDRGPVPAIGQPGGPPTSREALASTIATLRARLKTDPLDAGAAVVLADALLRQARVTGNAGLAIEADAALSRVLHARPADYAALRMRGAVLLSAHRFRDALVSATRARAQRPRDAWNYGVLGDGHLELGEYDEAFEAFDMMVRMKPGPAAYARVAYARELQGDLDGALEAMQMAAEATSAHDPESQAWYHAQLGNLHLERTALDLAEREFRRALFTFPDHPFATVGLARVAVARGDDRRAIELYERVQRQSPTGAVAADLGDLLASAGRADEAERQYLIADSVWRFDAPEPAKLAVFLADRDRKLEEALAIAEDAARSRHDIFTSDALAWARFKNGRPAAAGEAMKDALRTGSRDRRLRSHAAAIALALGDAGAARAHLAIATAGDLRFDLRLAAFAKRLALRLDAGPPLARR